MDSYIPPRTNFPKLPPELHQAIEDFYRWSSEKLDESHRPVEAPLYHYTDAAGLMGLLQSKHLWCTDYRHLNDPSELAYGLNLAHDVMKSAEANEDLYGRAFLDCVAKLCSYDGIQSLLAFFVASFSRNRDNLGQWRAYADNGRGFAVGFAPGMFTGQDKISGQPEENAVVVPVRYDISDLVDRHTCAIKYALKIFSEIIPEYRDRTESDEFQNFVQELGIGLITSQLIINSLTSKHPAYDNEEEVRLISLGVAQGFLAATRVRIRGNQLIPYVQYPWPLHEPGNIVEIVVGPLDQRMQSALCRRYYQRIISAML